MNSNSPDPRPGASCSPNTRPAGCRILSSAVRRQWPRVALLLALAACVIPTGCSFLKPAKPTARHYVLTPMPPSAAAPAASNSLALGVGQVHLPAYLFNTALAVRKNPNEIEYLPSDFWAERLDKGFQRALAANLALMLSTDRIHLSAWQKEDVAAEIYVTLDQFDVDATGRGLLVARWRILSPGGEKVLKAGSSRLVREGPPPNAGATGAVGTLSELAADFSRQLAQALQETAPGRHAAVRGSPSVTLAFR